MEKKLKVLNLYAGIGGNRKLWNDDKVEVTAVEIDTNIAKIYRKHFKNDVVVIGDAHKYLLDHYKEFDFIWSSPPCPTHSDIRRVAVQSGNIKAKYPNMKLYQEIILLKHFAKCKWVVENVKSYYNPLIKPFESDRHYFWSNFFITNYKMMEERIHGDVVGSKSIYGFDISKEDVNDKRKILRNLVNPRTGLHIFKCAFKERQVTLELNKEYE